MTIAFNFTVVARNSHFNGVTSIVIAMIGTDDNQAIFRLADGTAHGTDLRIYTRADPEVQIGGTVTTFSGSIIMLNNPADPVPPDTYDLTIASVGVGVKNDGQLVVEQAETLMLILVPESEPYLASFPNLTSHVRVSYRIFCWGGEKK